MAATSHPTNAAVEADKADDDHYGWKEAFDAEMQRRLIEEDRIAWRNVCGVLLTIVTGGLLLGVVAVWISVR